MLKIDDVKHNNPRIRRNNNTFKNLKSSNIIPKVLIVDDDEFNYIALSSLLKNMGFNSEYANNGEQAIEMIKSNNEFDENSKELYQIVFMDCNMPIMDGYSATKIIIELINKGELRELPIIACTADVSNNNKKRCLKIGFNEVLFKPV